MCSPKGGTGKTTFSQNLLVLMAADGLNVVGVDLDPQETLTKWWQLRQKYAERHSNLPMFDVIAANIGQWRRVSSHVAAQGYDVAVFDMLPSVDGHIQEVDALCREAAAVVVTTGITLNDLSSTLPWISSLKSKGFRYASFLNRANRREVSFEVARGRLNRLGRVCPVEVRPLSDAYAFAGQGLAAADKPRSKARADFMGVWEYLRREIGIEEAAA